MRKVGLMWKNGVSVLLALSLFLLLTSGLIGCGSSNHAADSGGSSDSINCSAVFQAGIKAAVDAELAAATYKRGISVAVYKTDVYGGYGGYGGEQMCTYAAGFADGDYFTATGTAMTPATPGVAYSITKTFVSALVLTQIEAGLYDLTDTVEDLLGSNADYIALSTGQKARIRTTATVRQLLTHTSGMLDYASNLNALIPMCDPAASWKPADILENVVFEDLVAPDVFHYSNTNYVLLGMIAQQMDPTNRTLDTLLAAYFFTPLGITAWLGPLDGYPAGIAHPYDDLHALASFIPQGSFADFDVAISTYYPGPPAYNIYTGVGRGTWAAGGIIATAANLAKWGNQLYDPAGLAISTTVRTQLKNSAPSDGDYGYGVNYDDFTYADSTVGGEYSHGGGAPGYRTLLLYEKTKGITIAIMTNVNNYGGGAGSIVPVYTLAEEILNAYPE